MAKPTKTKSELEALILERARQLDLASIVRAVTVRAMRGEVAGANWIVLSTNASEVGDHIRRNALRLIVPEIREQFDLAEID